MDKRQCAICGATYTPTAYNQTRCPSCVAERRMRCAICGQTYTGSTYNRPGNRSRCPSCLAKLRADMRTGSETPQSDEARRRAFDNKSAAGSVNIKAALAARGTHPHTAAGSHAHAHAKIYFMQAPDGTRIETQNLRAFIAEHPDDFPNAAQARKQLYLVGRSLREPDGKFRHQYSYNGWRMFAPPVEPDATIARRAHREAIETKRENMRASNAAGYDQNNGGLTE